MNFWHKKDMLFHVIGSFGSGVALTLSIITRDAVFVLVSSAIITAFIASSIIHDSK